MKTLLVTLCLVWLLALPLAGRPSPSAPAVSDAAIVSAPAHSGFFDFSNTRASRTTGVRIAALGMALALMIMFRSKH